MVLLLVVFENNVFYGTQTQYMSYRAEGTFESIVREWVSIEDT